MRGMGISVQSNQIGLRIQILNNNDDNSSNLNRFFTGTVTLINSIGTTVSDISISKKISMTIIPILGVN